MKLTNRQQQILTLVAKGDTRKAAAAKIGLAPSTATSYIKDAIRQNNCQSTFELIYKAAKLNLI